MSSVPSGVRIAQTVGLTGAAWLSGNIAALSVNVIPALLQSHREEQIPLSITVKQFRNMYENGKAQNPPIALVTAVAFGYLAWAARSESTFPLAVQNSTCACVSSLYLTAAVLTLGIVPWTLATMRRTNQGLLDKANSTWVPDEKSSVDTVESFERWIVLNAVRSLLSLLLENE
ncbi:DUF1772 domain-containing protein [Aspergillus tanneri]|uniref:DUF1772 domain-containing protein n=1 Tax=Aspergillus tanneri TaxID=1220188 RepID=A0A5M9MPV4_9EURO|nr:uncharacterized protein ATNIH1004_004805 [Aspergillus tanneri]KAA8648918.1 hypothetical protein ATNIH1004_004805 [Aspergillus tanneri]